MNMNSACRVLVADDEPDTLHGLERMLGRRGYQVQGAGGGLEAAEKLRTGSFDVVVSDLRMPDLDGMDLLRLTRKKGKETPFIMITGYGTASSAEEAMKLGSLDYINKPFAVGDLVAAIEKGFKQTQATTEKSAAHVPEAVESPPFSKWLKLTWHEIQDLDLDPVLNAFARKAGSAFGTRFGFEKKYGKSTSSIVATRASTSIFHAEPRIPLYGEVYLVLESWGTLTEGEQTRLVQFLRRVVLSKLIPLW